MHTYEAPRYFLKLITDSTAEPVATSDIKRQVNLPTSFTGDDAWIADAITGVRKLFERRIPGGRAFINQTWDLTLDKFPKGDDAIEFPYPPLASITSIAYYDASGSTASLASSDYQTRLPTEQPGWIKPAVNKNWPSTQNREDAVTIRYVAGYGSAASNVPMPIRHAIKMQVAHLYENREAFGEKPLHEVPVAVDALLGAVSWGYYG